jgi:hypothetical protein
MAYNYRPTSAEEIKKLGVPKSKEKTILALFADMKASFGKSADEFITIDTAQSSLGNVKILKQFEGQVDLGAYKKKYPGLSLTFGNGSLPSSNSPTTQQQELVTLKIFEELLSSKTKNYKNFEQLLPVLRSILIYLMKSLGTNLSNYSLSKLKKPQTCQILTLMFIIVMAVLWII